MKPDRKKALLPGSRAEPQKPVRSRADYNEPSAASAAMPVWLFLGLALFVFWGFMYLDENAGGFNPKVYGSYASLEEVKKSGPEEDPLVVKGRAVYGTICIGCHQPNGLGIPNQFPPLAGSEWVNAAGADRIIRIVLHGLTGPVHVKNTEINQNMLPVGAAMNDDDVAAALSFVRQAWDNKAGPVKPEQVTAIRKATADHAQWTEAELLKIPIGQ